MEYAVRAETKEGDVVTLERGFPSLSEAEDYPVRLYLWRRVWVEPVATSVPQQPLPTSYLRGRRVCDSADPP
jgi:hypothetical protein